MKAIRRQEELDPIHSLYVDQWDWERVITKADRSIETLQETVKKIHQALLTTAEELYALFPQLHPWISKEVFFISSQELENSYPDLSSKERENAICKEYGTVFISQIGYPFVS